MQWKNYLVFVQFAFYVKNHHSRYIVLMYVDTNIKYHKKIWILKWNNLENKCEFLAFVSHYTIAYLVELIDKGVIEVAYLAWYA
jgi:hypothetical protein